MSTTQTRVSLATATAIAEELVALLSPNCERILIAGSIRRRRPDIGDIDLLAIPRTEPVTNLFGDSTSEVIDFLDARCDELLALGTLEQRLDKHGRTSWGTKLKRARYRGLGVDIRACTDETTWGAWLVIATGPGTFSKWLVSQRANGGALPPGYRFESGFRLNRFGGFVETPTEESVFAALGLEYVAPEDR